MKTGCPANSGSFRRKFSWCNLCGVHTFSLFYQSLGCHSIEVNQSIIPQMKQSLRESESKKVVWDESNSKAAVKLSDIVDSTYC